MHLQTITASPPAQGLSSIEARTLQERYGANKFTASGKSSPIKTLWNIVREPMFLLLLLACSLYFLLGENVEGLLMLTAMVLVAGISFYQEVKSAFALAALERYTEPKTIVIRDGREQAIAPSDLVPGDWVIVEEGTLVPADATLIQANDLSANESILTGESMPVEKHAWDGDRSLFQGTLISSGKGCATVTAIGNATALGKLGRSIETIPGTRTLLQKQIARFVKIMALIGGCIFCLIWSVNTWHTGEVIGGLLLGLTLAMSIIPEEIPVAFSSFMALGAFRMAKRGMITRQPQTIEHLGAVSVICLDKTGTITENRMTIAALYDYKKDVLQIEADGAALQDSRVLYFGRLASERSPFDAMEKAIVEAFDTSFDLTAPYPEIVHEYPLGGRPPMMTHVYRIGGKTIVAGKGAPERIMTVCRLDPSEHAEVSRYVTTMAEKGYRVLGVCAAVFEGQHYPVDQDAFAWEMQGLLAFYDPPKPEVAAAFDKWRKAGISIRLVTGDFKETARTIAAQVGLPLLGEAVTGNQVMKAGEKEIGTLVRQNSLFVRMFPEAKLKLVEALKKSGDVVAMLGDGVNDGPALKAADIGIAMGNKGTEIARLAADLVLTDDDLGKVSDAIGEGRKIYDNLKKAIRYIVSIHIPIIAAASLPLLLNWRYSSIFTPIHVIFLELIMGPTCSIFFENEPVEPTLMNKAPRGRSKSLFSLKELWGSIVQGGVITLGLLSLYYYFMQQAYPVAYVRTMVFITLVIANVFLTFADRSFDENIFRTIRYPNYLTKYILIFSLLFLSALLFIPFIRQLFGLVWLGWRSYLLCLIVGFASTWWVELYKLFHTRRFRLSSILILVCIAFSLSAAGQQLRSLDSATIQRELMACFKRQKPMVGLWCDTSDRATQLRAALLKAYHDGVYEGVEGRAGTEIMLAIGETDIRAGIMPEWWERRYNEAALMLGWDYFRGAGAEKKLSYDGVSALYLVRDEQCVAAGLAKVRTAAQLQAWLSGLLPAAKEYTILRDSLAASLDDKRPARAARLMHAMNDYRWVHHFPFNKVIVVNIPSADLHYYEVDTLQLWMRVVAGQPSKRTPRFAGWCDGIVLYPYWNVPRRIAVHELLPLFKDELAFAKSMQLEVVDDHDHVIDPDSVRWADYNAKNFPFRIRQAPGCGNALGVLKFNLSDPFNIYMHDTNLKNVFGKDYRYYSHGCIRLERPFDLGLELMQGKLDTMTLKACFKYQQPVPLPLPKPVPVFVLYHTVGVDNAGKLTWYKDIYQLGW